MELSNYFEVRLRDQTVTSEISYAKNDAMEIEIIFFFEIRSTGQTSVRGMSSAAAVKQGVDRALAKSENEQELKSKTNTKRNDRERIESRNWEKNDGRI